MKSIVGKLRIGRSQSRKSLALNKWQNGETHISCTVVGTGLLIMYIYRWYIRNKINLRGSVPSVLSWSCALVPTLCLQGKENY